MPSRRTVLRSGLALSSGALVSSNVGANPNDGIDHERSDDGAGGRSRAIPGVMHPVHYTPGARFTVDDVDVTWRPRVVREGDTTSHPHVITYDSLPSYRALLYSTGEELRPGEQYELESALATRVDGRFVGVDVAPVE